MPHTPGADQAFAEAAATHLACLYEAEPVMASAMGIRAYDDRLPNRSSFALEDRLRRERAFLHAIDQISLAELSPESRIDYRAARAGTQKAILTAEHLRPYRTQPGIYIRELFQAIHPLLERNTGSPETRGAAMLARLRGFGAHLAAARENLDPSPPALLHSAIELAEAAARWVARTVPAFAAGLRAPGLQRSLQAEAIQAAGQMASFAAWLRTEAPASTDSTATAGVEVLDYTLRVAHLLDEDSQQLLAHAREEMAHAREDLAMLAGRLEHGSSWQDVAASLRTTAAPASDLRAAWHAAVRSAREFVAARDLVNLPAPDSLQIVEVRPEDGALLPMGRTEPPPPFGESRPALLRIPSPDARRSAGSPAGAPCWSEHEIGVAAVREAWPGRALQALAASRLESRVRRHFADSPLLSEGWTAWSEELVRQEGRFADPRAALFQAHSRLLRACKAVVDLELHRGGMSPEEAVALLRDGAGLPDRVARAEASRCLAAPTDLAAELAGFRQIARLRDDVERARGARFRLRDFHDELLAVGAVPPRLLRDVLLSV